MSMYRKKPVEIEARQLTRESGPEIWEWADSKPLYGRTGEVEGLRIYTLEGSMRADFGDWIIRGVKGEFYPCKPDIFDATYEPVSTPEVATPETPPNVVAATKALDDWIAASSTPPEIVHHCPPLGEDVTSCCGRTPFELPRLDRLTADPTLVTCGPRATTPEPETMTWDWGPTELGHWKARQIAAWINASGGEARRVGNTIAVRTPDDWDFAAPGDTITMGSEWFNLREPGAARANQTRLRSFTVSSPEATTTVEIGGRVMTEAQFNAARFPLLSDAPERTSPEDAASWSPEATTPEPETMTWSNGCDCPKCLHVISEDIVAWIKKNDGEARYEPPSYPGQSPLIVIRGLVEEYAKPGDTITRRPWSFHPESGSRCPYACYQSLRVFTVSSPEATT